MIRLDKITVGFQSYILFDELDLKFNKSETTVILGTSGCGKSSIIRIICGLIKPISGNVFIDNEKLSERNIQKVRSKIGYVIQEGGLFPHLTIRDNLELQSKFYEVDKVKLENRIQELFRLNNLTEENLTKYPAQLSGGQRQRVALIRALISDPKILLLDEPLGALDPMIRSKLQSELKMVFKKLNKTVILVTHDLNEALFFADRIILINEGIIQQSGTPHEIVHNPVNEFVSEFINSQRSIEV